MTTNIERIKRMDAKTLAKLLDKIREGDIDYGTRDFCGECVQTKENGKSCEKCLEEWLNLNTCDTDYFSVDYQLFGKANT